jgi:hypothetical protein
VVGLLEAATGFFPGAELARAGGGAVVADVGAAAGAGAAGCTMMQLRQNSPANDAAITRPNTDEVNKGLYIEVNANVFRRFVSTSVARFKA